MSFRIGLLLSFLSFSTFVESYVNYKTYLPSPIQVKWLKKLTMDISECPTLSEDMLDDAPKVMKGWSTFLLSSSSYNKKVGAENAVAVEALIKRLVSVSEVDKSHLLPTTLDYNIMLNLWVRSGEGVFAAERCEQILTTMQEVHESNGAVQPNLESFKAILLAWKYSNVPFKTYRAQRILEWMIRLYRDGKNDLALPDSECFEIVLQLWSRSDDPEAATKAERLLGEMDRLAKETHHHENSNNNNNNLKPTTYSFNAVLGAWSRKSRREGSSNNNNNIASSTARLCDVLSIMERLEMADLASYHIVMSALARSCSNTESLEDGMKKQKRNNNSKELIARKAESFLRSVEDKCKDGTLSWKPDEILFNSAMSCWSHCDTPGAYRKARSVLDRQLNLYNSGKFPSCKPDVIGFTSVLSSCASEPSPKERQKAFYVALATFQQLEKKSHIFGSPNHVTLGTMLKACARLLPNGSLERKKWTKYFFEQSKARGLVGGMVLSRVREAASSPDEYRELMQGHTKNSLPQKWNDNVHEMNVYRRNPQKNKRKRRKKTAEV